MHTSKRRTRYHIPGSIHELTFACYRNLPLLTTERTNKNLAGSVIKAAQTQQFKVIAYVFMPTHVHLLVMPGNKEYSIPAFLKSVKQPVARKEILYLRENEPEKLEKLSTGWKKPQHLFWQRGGGYDRTITNADNLESAIAYIHLNPVRKNLVKQPVDWEWSSAVDWLKDEPGKIPVIKKIC